MAAAVAVATGAVVAAAATAAGAEMAVVAVAEKSAFAASSSEPFRMALLVDHSKRKMTAAGTWGNSEIASFVVQA